MTTAIKLAFDKYAVAPDHAGRRVAFLGAFLRSEVHLVLAEDAEGDQITPVIQQIEGQDAVVVFDDLDPLSEYAGGQADQITLSGRSLCQMLAGQGLGCVINPGSAVWSYVIDGPTLDWMADHLDHAPQMDAPGLDALQPARLADLNVVEAMDATLPACRDRAAHAILVQVNQDGQDQLVLFFVDTVAGAEGALSQIVQDMVTFAGTDLPPINVAFAQSGTELHGRLSKIGLGMDIPQTPQPEPLAAPGADPSKPPKLR